MEFGGLRHAADGRQGQVAFLEPGRGFAVEDEARLDDRRAFFTGRVNFADREGDVLIDRTELADNKVGPASVMNPTMDGWPSNGTRL